MTLKHKQRNGIAKTRKNSQASPAVSTIQIREANRAAKAIQSVKFVNDNEKKAALRKLARAAASTRSKVRGAAKAQ